MSITVIYNFIRDIYLFKYELYMYYSYMQDTKSAFNISCQLDLLYLILKEIRNNYEDYSPYSSTEPLYFSLE